MEEEIKLIDGKDKGMAEMSVDNFLKKWQINWDAFKIILMIGMIIVMIVLGIVIFKYGSAIKADPCEFCDCLRGFKP